MKFPPGPILDRDVTDLPNFPKGVVVFDRDGTLIEDAGQHNDPSRLVFLPGAIDAVGLLNSLNYGVAIASNQAGLESDKFSIRELNKFNDALKFEFSRNATASINLIAVCPHLATSNCNCRKPEIGLFQAIEDSGLGEIKLFVGDSRTDALAAASFNIDYLHADDQDLLVCVQNWLGEKCD